jgi:DNA-binding response OmpR family regulator
MADERRMLVVDDEQVVCHACRSIFSRQGFQVETQTDSRQGLSRGVENDYAIILLDIKMPNMDGIEFLQRLRDKKPDVPVLIITGYPSIPNAAAVMRLGACDYVTKPFTVAEVTWAVQRVLNMQHAVSGEDESAAQEREAVVAAMANIQTLFWHESWVQLAVDGSASVGAVLPGLRGVSIAGIRMPRIGEVVYQGLPLAGVSVSGKPMLLVPSPISGVVAGTNDLLVRRPNVLARDPCGEGWIACICATRNEEMEHCKPRRLLLVNSDADSAAKQAKTLESLGCEVRPAANAEALLADLTDGVDPPRGCPDVVFLDAAALGDAGPPLVERINRQFPRARIVVIGSSASAGEAAYRKQKIFYYAVEPFVDNEIADILVGVFHAAEAQPAKAERPKGPSEPISSVSITNRNLHKVQLLAAAGLLWANEGLGLRIAQQLLAQTLPVVVTPGETQLTPANILKAAGTCDRVLVLLARDGGLLPGGLAVDTKPEFDVPASDLPAAATVGKVTMLSVQPDNLGGFACLDARTIAALADQIVWDMASY